MEDLRVAAGSSERTFLIVGLVVSRRHGVLNSRCVSVGQVPRSFIIHEGRIYVMALAQFSKIVTTISTSFFFIPCHGM